jgi:catechol 2,3-dioxygenase
MKARPRLGHVQLRVQDLARSRWFYERLLGWTVREGGSGIAFLGPGPDHHQLALLEVGPGAPCAPHAGGLSHVAFEVGGRDALVDMYRRLVRRGVTVNCFDLGVSWSLYLKDPDGNEVEIYCDTRETPDGRTAWGGRGAALGLAHALARARGDVVDVS